MGAPRSGALWRTDTSRSCSTGIAFCLNARLIADSVEREEHEMTSEVMTCDLRIDEQETA